VLVACCPLLVRGVDLRAERTDDGPRLRVHFFAERVDLCVYLLGKRIDPGVELLDLFESTFEASRSILSRNTGSAACIASKPDRKYVRWTSIDSFVSTGASSGSIRSELVAAAHVDVAGIILPQLSVRE